MLISRSKAVAPALHADQNKLHGKTRSKDFVFLARQGAPLITARDSASTGRLAPPGFAHLGLLATLLQSFLRVTNPARGSPHRKVIVWGNRSTTQYPDLSHAVGGQPKA